MKQRLATAAEVIALAFADAEYMPEKAISDAEIAVAEERSVIPVTGLALYEKMRDGGYGDFRREYVVPVVAYFTRLGMQPMTDVRSGRFGTAAPRSEFCQPAERQQILDLRRTLLRKGRTMQRRMSDFLERNAADFPEYRSDDNFLNRCSTDGGILQIR